MQSAGDLAALPASARRTVQGFIRDQGMADCRLLLSEGSAKGENYLGEITRIQVAGKVDEKESELNLIVKVPPRTAGLRDSMPINKIFKKEYLAYSEVLPTLYAIQERHAVPMAERFVPAKLYTGGHEDMEEVLLFADLAAEGFVMHDRLTPFDIEHVHLTVRNLARYHATCFALQKHDSKEFLRFNTYVSHGMGTGEVFYKMTVLAFERLVANVEDASDREIVRRFGETLVQTLDACVDPTLTAPYNVLCHGDCWCNNFLFRYEGGRVVDMRLLDWQMIRLASPVTDLAYMLFLSTTAEMRRDHFHSLLDLYYSTLSDHLSMLGCEASRLYPEPVYRKQLQDVLPFGLIMSALVIPFILSTRGESPDLDKAIAGAENGGVEFIYSQLIIDRIKEVVADCIRYKIIS